MTEDKKIAYEMIEMTVLREFLEDDLVEDIVAKILDHVEVAKAYAVGVALMHKAVEIARKSSPEENENA